MSTTDVGRRLSAVPAFGPRMARFVALNLAIFTLVKAAITATTYYLPTWDEAVYLGIGKHLYSGGRAGLFEVIRPPGLPLIIGAFWRVGLDPLWCARVVSWAFAALAVVLSYDVARRLYSPLAGAIAAVLLTWAPLFFISSSKVMTEIPSSVFLLLALWLMLRGADFLSGLSAGSAFLMRYPTGIMLLAAAGLELAGIFAARSRSARLAALLQMARFSAGGLASIGPYLAVNALLYRPYTDSYWQAAVRPILLAGSHANNPFESITGHGGPAAALYEYLSRLGLQSPALLAGLAAASVAAALPLVRRRASWSAVWAPDPRVRVARLSFATLFVAIVFLANIVNTQERFLLPVLPLIAIASGGALAKVVERPVARGPVAALVLISVALGFWRGYQDYAGLPPAGVLPPIVEFCRKIDRLLAPGAAPIATSDPVLAAFTDRPVVPFYEDTDPRTVFINDGDDWENSVAKASLVLYAPSSYSCLPGMAWCADREPALRAKVFALGPVVGTFCPDDPEICLYLVRPIR